MNPSASTEAPGESPGLFICAPTLFAKDAKKGGAPCSSYAKTCFVRVYVYCSSPSESICQVHLSERYRRSS